MYVYFHSLVKSINKTVSTVIRIAVTRDLLKKHITTPLYQNAYYLMASNAIATVLGFVFWSMAAWLYSEKEVGLASAIIAALGLLSLLSGLGLDIGLIRFLPGAGKKGNEMLNTCFTVSGALSIVIALIFLAGLDIWSPDLLLVRQQPCFFISFSIWAIVMTLNSLLQLTFLAKRNTKFTFFFRAIRGFLNVALVGFIALFSKSAFGIFISSFLAGAVTLAIAVFWFLPKVQSGYRPFIRIQRGVISELWRYSAVNYLAQILLQMNNFILPLIVLNLMGATMNAYFFYAWMVASILRLIPISISNSMFAEAAMDEQSLRANTIKSLRLMLLLVLPAILLLLVIADWFLLIFGQTYSDNGSMLLRWLVLSTVPWGINYLYISIVRVSKNIWDLVKVAGAMTILSLGLSYLLALKMDLVGVGIGYLGGQSIVAIASAVGIWQHYHSHFERSG